MNELDGPRGKLDRAAEHIKTLNEIVRKWYDTKPLRVIPKQFNSNDMTYTFRVEYAPIPLSFGIIAGDIFHNLRSALDHLVWQLALLTTSAPFDRTAFPICINDNGESRRHIKRLLQHVTDDARQVIDSLQPYHTGDVEEAKTHALWFIDQMSNFDKHRIITVSSGLTQVSLKGGVSEKWLNEGAVELVVHVTDKNLPPPIPNFRYGLLVGDKIVGNGIQLAAIRIFHDYIRYDVFPLFERFFPESKAVVK